MPRNVIWQACQACRALARIADRRGGYDQVRAQWGTAQVLVRWEKPSIVRVFEVDSRDLQKPLPPAVAVTSIAPAGTSYEAQGYSAADSVVRFTVPERANGFWKTRTFIIRLCGQGTKQDAQAWAIISPRVSRPILAKVISVFALVLLYIAFASAIYTTRGAPHPLAPKWPAYDNPRKFKWLEYLDPVVLTANAFNKGSIQKLQVLLFTLLVAGMVLTLVLTAGFLPNFSSTVAMLLGISAVGAAVAQKTTTSSERIQFENWAWLVKKKVLPITRQDTPRWTDLMTSGREFDIYKLQTLLFSGVVAVALLVNGGTGLESFTVPETLLGILGLSQVVYIAGSLVRPPSVSDLDKAITELREMGAKVTTALAQNTDTDSDGKLMSTPLPPGATPGANAMAQYNKKADQVEVMLESTLETEVTRAQLDYP